MSETLYQTPLHTFVEFVKILVAALIIAVILRSFVIQPFIIPSESMLDTLQVGDRLFVSKFSYGIHLPFVEKEIFSTGEPRVGDIVVFPFPQNRKEDYIKRVVGVPGDRLEMRNKQLFRNGLAVDEPYAIHTARDVDIFRDNFPQRTVPDGKVFVLGDNRDNSKDSRYWGYVDKDEIHGRAFIIYWSSVNLVNVKWGRIGRLLQ
ncbi:MAG: signal peptidase I [Desulfovibrio sp.]|jgi:signal peptidase I|nr:signal peptidase I [Desulfovibrio sp.]